MYKILKAETLAAKIHLMVVHAPRVASHCQPGQFIIVKLDEKGERIPLTICDYDREEGTVTIVFQEIGVSTIKMAELKAGDAFRDFVGPLGCPSKFVEEDIEELKKKKIKVEDLLVGLCRFDQEAYSAFCDCYPQIAAGTAFNPMTNMDVVKLYQSVVDALVEQTEFCYFRRTV